MTSGAGVSTACGWGGGLLPLAAGVGAGCGLMWHPVTSCGTELLPVGAGVGASCGCCGVLKSDLAASCYPYNPLVQEWQTGSIESFDVAGFA